VTAEWDIPAHLSQTDPPCYRYRGHQTSCCRDASLLLESCAGEDKGERRLQWDRIIEEFVTVWVVVDPIGTIPVFIAVTSTLSAAKRRAAALQAVLVAACVLLFFIICGQLLLDALAISLVSFRIAGGIVLFLFALTMIFGPSKPESEIGRAEETDQNPAIFPLAVPSIASPGAMLAVVVLTDNNRLSIPEQAWTTGVTFLVLAITLILLLLAGPILRVIRESGASIVSRVMGMVLAAVAVDGVLEALDQRYFSG